MRRSSIEGSRLRVSKRQKQCPSPSQTFATLLAMFFQSAMHEVQTIDMSCNLIVNVCEGIHDGGLILQTMFDEQLM
jgi:hypothetical protein